MSTVKCANCNTDFYRDQNKVNESIKFGWKSFCSVKCQSSFKTLQRSVICSREDCKNVFLRTNAEYLKSKLHFCSHRCSALVNNAMRQVKPAIIKKCLLCGRNYAGHGIKYCSPICQSKNSIIPSEVLIDAIKTFYNKNGRIPFKKEMPHYHAIRGRFGTWNNAIEAAGFDPNPVMFAKHYFAKDGHKCDSLSERIIDDWLFRRNIKHEIHFPYPEDRGFTVDFKVKDYWVEFFGLSGELKRYDELKSEKLSLAKKYNLKLISIFPEDLFPISNLNNNLKILL